MEAVAVLEEREAADRTDIDKTLVQANTDALFNDPDSWVGGNQEGDITMVEFADYCCGYRCKAHDEVTALLKWEDNNHLIIKDFSINNEASTKSAWFAITVRQVAGD